MGKVKIKVEQDNKMSCKEKWFYERTKKIEQRKEETVV